MEFGRMLGHRVEGNQIILQFEKGQGRIELLTERIVNVFAGRISSERRSRAIEGEKAAETAFDVRTESVWLKTAGEGGDQEEREVLVISTSFLQVKVYDEFKVDFYNSSGEIICRDYRGEVRHLQRESEREKKLLEAEGHSVQQREDYPVCVYKQMEGDESFYGLGDKGGFINKRGYDYVMWNTDDPSPHTEHYKSLYKTIPFFITLRENAVFGLFFDNTYRSWFDMGKESEDYYGYGVLDGNLDYYLIAGLSMPEIVEGYTYLTGTTPLPQKWTLGYHQSRWSYMSENEIRQIAENMRRYRIPCDVIHLDIDYMDNYKVFTWNQERFQNEKKMLSDLEREGFKVVTIIDPGVKVEEGYYVYDEGVEEGYFATAPDGEIYQNVVWPGDAVYPDFGREAVRNWWAEKHSFLLEKGVRGVWNDMNEPASFRGQLPDDLVFTDEDEKTDHRRVHNIYGHNMSRATYQGLKELDRKRPFVITRACYAGIQKFSTVWTGDNHSLWSHLQMVIPQLCNLGLSGISFAGTDVGGFGSDCTKELLCRWVQAGSFSPLFRNHSAVGTRYQEPWQFDDETLDIYRKAVELRYHLIPYYYDLFFTGEKNGLPVLRPLVLHYEKDPQVRDLDSEFLVGEQLLAAPVVSQGDRKKLVYLPEGIWYDYMTGERLEGNRWLIREAPLDVCPLYVKAGTILPVWPRQSYVGELDVDDTLMLEVFPGEGGWLHFQDQGESFAYRDGAYNQYRFRLTKEGKLTISTEHSGYEKKYGRVVVSCQGRSLEAELKDGACEIQVIWEGA